MLPRQFMAQYALANALATAILLLGASPMNAQAYTDLERSALDRLDRATDWLVRYGPYAVEARGDAFLKAKLHDLGPVVLWVTPQVDENDKLALFRIKAGGYNTDLEALWRKTISGRTYDYWVAQTSAQDYVTDLHACTFYVSVRAQDGQRRILEKSGTFIDAYITPEGERFVLPTDNPKVLYALRAWQWPQCFPGSDLPATWVRLTESGAMVVEPYPTAQ